MPTKMPTVDYAAFGRAVATIIANTRRRSANSDDATRRDLEAFDAILAEADDHIQAWTAKRVNQKGRGK